MQRFNESMKKMALNKEAFITLLADKADVSPSAAGRMLDAFAEIVAREMERGGRIQLRRFGSFEVVKRAGRMGTNPSDSTPIKIHPKKVVRFVAGSTLRERVSKKR